MEDRAKIAAVELERVAHGVRERPRPGGGPDDSPRVDVRGPLPPPGIVALNLAPERPSGAAVNELWRIPGARQAGFRGWLLSLVSRCFRTDFETQERFNSAQVRLDNELVEWIEARFAATHGHYDTVLGQMGHHLGEIDTRHLMLQAEVVKHTHDLVRRIDLVLAESEKSRMVLTQTLRDVRDRLATLEERLQV
jgi:hypothetical protein